MRKKLSSPIEHLPVPVELIERRIYVMRGQKVMLDADLADLYGVPTKVLNQAVKRNLYRFPPDFMFRLNRSEADEFNRSQIVTGSQKHRDPRSLPYAFTEHGVAMLASVLNSQRAVLMNIVIIRAFIKLRELLVRHKDLAHKIEQLEASQKQQGAILALVAKDVQDLGQYVAGEFKKLKAPRRRKPRIGFLTGENK